MSGGGLPPSQRWCPVCHRDVLGFSPGPSGRPDATCPYCGAHERQRFLSLLLEGLAPWLSGASLVLDVAPSRQMSRQLRRLCPRGYLSLDYDPAADGRHVDVRASLTALPLADDSVDLALVYHVLEHVPDDRAAMSEIARVLKPGGMALVQVPWRGGRETDEDPTAPRAERVRRFGQADHVRYYGRDLDARFVESGLDVVRFTPLGVVGRRGCELMRLVPDEAVWAVRARSGSGEDWSLVEGLAGGPLAFLVRLVAEGRARDRRTAPALERSAVLEGENRQLTRERAAVSAELGRARREVEHLDRERTRLRRERRQLREELTAAEVDAARWEGAYRRLRGRAPVRWAAGTARLAREVLPARRAR